MKKLLIFSLLITLMLTGCGINSPKADFKFFSLDWGCSWDTAKTNKNLQNADFEIKEAGSRQTVKFKDIEYLAAKIDTVTLVFDIGKNTSTTGLYNVFLQFDEENKKILLEELTKIYGEAKTTYLDKNGVENPLNPAGWVSKDALEDTLTDKEKEFYIAMFNKKSEQSRINALLRAPLVTIKFNESRNIAEFNGTNAAVVEYIRTEMKK